MLADARVFDLLARTSRTFALAVPLLEPALARDVALAYLLFRVADTVEDETTWPADVRADLLHDFSSRMPHLDRASAEAFLARLAALPAVASEDCRELLNDLPALALSLEPTPSHEAIRKHVARTARGMSETLARGHARGRPGLDTLEELRAYCYFVAGIVGELLTDAFVLAAPTLASVDGELRLHDARFGEGLQLVNVLKDRRDDAEHGRAFVPPEVPESTLFSLAREDLGHAERYVRALARGGATRGMLAFTRLPLALARETLDLVERHGPGTKVSRERVGRLLAELDRPLEDLGA
jgi:farnesyl-diphosphate farnesyltransferase